MPSQVVLPDDSTRPKAPEIPQMTDAHRMAGRHLKMIHDHHRQNMGVLRQVISAAEKGEMDAPTMTATLEALPFVQNYRQFGALCGQYCQIIHGHHSIEDAHMLPALSAKAAAFKKVTDRLMEEHKIVHALLVELIGALNILIQDPTKQHFSDAREIYETLERLLNSHFKYEEDSVGDALGFYNIGI